MNIRIFILVSLLQVCFAPPVTKNKKENEEDSKVTNLEDYMEYHRYLKEVVNALESDANFKKKLEQANEEEIKSGKIAEELEFVSHHVRSKLDEIKRVELERLKHLIEKKRMLENEDNSIDDPSHHHLDHKNPHTFEIEDLKKLIAKTTQDLAEADKKREQEFKQYELEKEYQKELKLNNTNGEERDKLEKQMKELENKHKKHEPLHQPGHKAQLEEVWEEQDHMQQDFDPKTFFMLHDIDGNGLWDQDEVKALFIKELDKMYQQGAPEDDMRERAEEMERMRESVFREMDRNRDGFIDFEEFLQETKSNDFKEDNGWQSLDEQRPYTDEELAEYIRMHQANQVLQNYPHPGMGYQVPPMPGHPQEMHPGGYQQVPVGGYHQQVPPGSYQQVPQGYQQVPPGVHPNAIPAQAQFHPGQVAQHPPQQLPHNYVPPLNTNEIYPNQPQYNPPAQQQRQVQPPQPPQPQQQIPQQQINQGQQPQAQAQPPHPQVQQAHAEVQQGLPQAQQGLPQVQQGIPQVQQGIPQVQQGIPQVQQEIPQVQREQPQMQQGQPQQGQVQPVQPQAQPAQHQMHAAQPQAQPVQPQVQPQVH